MGAGKVWNIEDATAWLAGYSWGGEVSRHMQLAANAEQREQWLWVVVAMRAVMERCARDGACNIADEYTDTEDLAGIFVLAAGMEEEAIDSSNEGTPQKVERATGRSV